MTSRRPHPLGVEAAPRIQRRTTPARRAPRRRPTDTITPRRAYGALALWWALLVVMQSVIPEPADVEALGTLDQIMSVLVTMGVIASTLLLASLSRLGAWAAVATGGALTALAVACPVTGHHEFAPWWFVYTGAAIGMTAVGLWATRAHTFDGA